MGLTYHLVSPAFLDNTNAYAIGDLTVNWGVAEGNPIFTINNFTPGQTSSKLVTVTNNATVSRSVGVRGVLTSETGNISQAVDFVISQGGIDLYGGTAGNKTLAQFFTDSTNPEGIFLSNLNPSNSTDYTFKATFLQNADNNFQGKSIIFDLKIGISNNLPAQCQNITFNKTIFGKQGNDILVGTNGNDLIYGMGGNDIILGGGGNDCIIAGDGNDIIGGGSGNDVVIGNGGNDAIDGGDGNDYVEGDNGNDIISGASGNDILIGGANIDIASGGSGIDNCQAEIKANCEF